MKLNDNFLLFSDGGPIIVNTKTVTVGERVEMECVVSGK